jgi:hypothetical protein
MNRQKLLDLYAEWYSRAFERGIWPKVMSLVADPDRLADYRSWAKFAYRHVLFAKMEATGRLAERHTRYALSFLFLVPTALAFAVILTGTSFAVTAVAVFGAVLSATVAKSLYDSSFGNGHHYVEVGTKVIDPGDRTLEWFLGRESDSITMAGAVRLMKFGEVLTQGGFRGIGRAYVSFTERSCNLRL